MDKEGIISNSIFSKSKISKIFKFNKSDSLEEELKIEDDKLPGFLYKIIEDKYMLIQ